MRDRRAFAAAGAGYGSSENAADAWVVGQGGVILHGDGAAWSTIPSGVTDELNEVGVRLVGLTVDGAGTLWTGGEDTSVLSRVR